jgi:hypothetical protein
MTAAELYEIVKDVPRDSWPKTNGVTYRYRLEEDGPHDVEWWFWGGTEEDPSGHVEARMVLLEAAFVGSMVAWLLNEELCPVLDKTKDGYMVKCISMKRIEDPIYEAPTLIQALAAACKEVGT